MHISRVHVINLNATTTLRFNDRVVVNFILCEIFFEYSSIRGLYERKFISSAWEENSHDHTIGRGAHINYLHFYVHAVLKAHCISPADKIMCTFIWHRATYVFTLNSIKFSFFLPPSSSSDYSANVIVFQKRRQRVKEKKLKIDETFIWIICMHHRAREFLLNLFQVKNEA